MVAAVASAVVFVLFVVVGAGNLLSSASVLIEDKMK
jgi:hypothetical protein